MFQYKGTSLLNFVLVSIYYAVSVIKRSSVRPSVRLSRRSTAAAAAGGFAAGARREQQIG